MKPDYITGNNINCCKNQKKDSFYKKDKCDKIELQKNTNKYKLINKGTCILKYKIKGTDRE